ncbi:MAG: hypothetical protein WBV59_11885 [Anaerolineae bacterium]
MPDIDVGSTVYLSQQRPRGCVVAIDGSYYLVQFPNMTIWCYALEVRPVARERMRKMPKKFYKKPGGISAPPGTYARMSEADDEGPSR